VSWSAAAARTGANTAATEAPAINLRSLFSHLGLDEIDMPNLAIKGKLFGGSVIQLDAVSVCPRANAAIAVAADRRVL
jgi:hypothetical protein